MSNLEAKKIAPATGTTVTLGAAGDTVDVSATALKTNTVKDAGGNTLFTSDGSGTLSSVNSAFKGGMIFISSQTAPAGTGTVSFTANIDSTYNEYMFVMTEIATSSDSASFQVNFHDSSGTNLTKTTTTFNAAHSENGTGGELGYNTGTDLAQSTNPQDLADYNLGNDADQCLAGILHLFAPSSTTYVKQFMSTTQFYENGNQSWNMFVAGYVNTTTAVAQVSFTTNTGTFSGTIALYGTGK